MMFKNPRLAIPPVAVAAALCAAFGLSACGDDQAGGSDSSAGKNGAPADASSEEQAVYDTYARFVNDIYSGNAAGACQAMTPRIRKQMRTLGVGQPTCERQVSLVLDTDSKKVLRPRIVRLSMNGDKALAKAKAGNSQLYDVPFVKRGEEWKIDGGLTPN